MPTQEFAPTGISHAQFQIQNGGTFVPRSPPRDPRTNEERANDTKDSRSVLPPLRVGITASPRFGSTNILNDAFADEVRQINMGESHGEIAAEAGYARAVSSQFTDDARSVASLRLYKSLTGEAALVSLGSLGPPVSRGSSVASSGLPGVHYSQTPTNSSSFRARPTASLVPFRPATVMGLAAELREQDPADEGRAVRVASSLGFAATDRWHEGIGPRGPPRGGVRSPVRPARSPSPVKREVDNPAEIDFASPLIPEAWLALLANGDAGGGPSGGYSPKAQAAGGLRERLAPAALHRKGLSPLAVYRLYRALRVYSAGFHKVVYEVAAPLEGESARAALLADIWQFYSTLWDSALFSAFDSEVHVLLAERLQWEAAAEERSEEAATAQEKLQSTAAALDAMVKQSLEHSVERAGHAAALETLRSELEEARERAVAKTEAALGAAHASELAELETRRATQEACATAAQEELVGVRQELLERTEAAAQLEAALVASQSAEVATQQHMVAAQATAKDLEVALDGARERLMAAEAAAATKETEYAYKDEEWRAMYRAYQYLKGDIEFAKAELADREEDVRQLKAESSEMAEKLDKAHTQINNLTLTLGERDKTIAAQLQQIQDLSKLTTLQAQTIQDLEATLQKERRMHEDALALKDAACEQTLHEMAEAHRESLVLAENNCAVATQKQKAADASMKEYWEALARKRTKKRHWKGEHAIRVTEGEELRTQLTEVRAKCDEEKAAMQSKLKAQMTEMGALRKKMEDSSAAAWLREEELTGKLSEASKDLAELHRLMEERAEHFKTEVGDRDALIKRLQMDLNHEREVLEAATLNFDTEMATMRLHIANAQDLVATADLELNSKKALTHELEEAMSSTNEQRDELERAMMARQEAFDEQLRETEARAAAETAVVAEQLAGAQRELEAAATTMGAAVEAARAAQAEELSAERAALAAQLAAVQAELEAERKLFAEAKGAELEAALAKLAEAEVALQLQATRLEEASHGASGTAAAAATASGDPAQQVAELTVLNKNLEDQRRVATELREKQKVAAAKDLAAAVAAADARASVVAAEARTAAEAAVAELENRLAEAAAAAAAAVAPLEAELAAAQEAGIAKDAAHAELAAALEQTRAELAAARADHASAGALLEAAQADIRMMREELAQALKVSDLRSRFAQALTEVVKDKAAQLKEVLAGCPAHAAVEEKLVKMQFGGGTELSRALPEGTVGELARRCGLSDPEGDPCLNELDAEWHTLAAWMNEDKMTLVALNEEVAHLREQKDAVSDEAAGLQDTLDEVRSDAAKLEEQVSAGQVTVMQLTHQKAAQRDLVKGSVILVLGYLGIRRDAVKEVEALIEATVADAAPYSKLPELSSKLQDLAKRSMVGSGVSYLEDHTLVLQERIADLGAKEAELMAHVEDVLELHDLLCDRLNQLHDDVLEMGNRGEFFLKKRFGADRSETEAAMARNLALQAKVDALNVELGQARGEIDKLTVALFSSASAAEKGQMAIGRVEDMMERLKKKHRGEMLLIQTQERMRAGATHGLTEQANKIKEAAMEKVAALEKQVKFYQAREQTSETERTELQEKLAAMTKRVASQAAQLLEMKNKERGSVGGSRPSSRQGGGRITPCAEAMGEPSPPPSSAVSREVSYADIGDNAATAAEAPIEDLPAKCQALSEAKARLEQQLHEAHQEKLRLQMELHRWSAASSMAPSLRADWLRSVGDRVEQYPVQLDARTLRLVISHIYQEKMAADVKDDEAGEPRQNLREFVYDFFLFKFGLQMYTEVHLHMLLRTLETSMESDPTIALFGALCGAEGAEPMSPNAVHFYLYFLSNLYDATHGPSKRMCATGTDNVQLEEAKPVVAACLAGVIGDTEVEQLHLDLFAQAADDGDIEIGILSLLVMKAWSHEDSNRGKKLQQALIESDENQDCVLSFDEFNTVINKVAPNTHSRTIRKMWRLALNNSDNGGMNVITPQTLEDVARSMGVGVLQHMLPQAVVRPQFAFNEVAFLQDSWSHTKPVILAMMEKAATENMGSNSSLRSLEAKISALGELLSGMHETTAETTANTWSLYRQILLEFQMHDSREEMMGREDLRKTLGEGAYGHKRAVVNAQ